jgi:Rps23 Pro-64 3,4-dihydroxylase Tpa1-like proline 4-hydroxylase
VPGILPVDCALALAQCLERDVEWNLTLWSGNRYFDVPSVSLAASEPAVVAEIRRRVHEQACDEYQLFYETQRLTEAGEPYEGPNVLLREFVQFMNSCEFLTFAREIFAEPRIAIADVQATRYRGGHFVHTHDDQEDNKKRYAAYILNLTPDWRPDWGGYLKFVDGGGHIDGGMMPAFNAINFFRVPFPHFVSMVSDRAPRSRHSITGWFRGV